MITVISPDMEFWLNLQAKVIHQAPPKTFQLGVMKIIQSACDIVMFSWTVSASEELRKSTSQETDGQANSRMGLVLP